MDRRPRRVPGLALVLLLGAGCQSEENKQALANIATREQAGADHQTRARVGYEAIATRLDTATERIAASLQGHPYRGGEFAEALKHPGVARAAELAGELVKDLGARCAKIHLVVGTSMLPLVDGDCAVSSKCHQQPFERDGVRVESCDLTIDGAQLSGIVVERTHPLPDGELRVVLHAPAA